MAANPYADLSALIDSTRELDPEEMAELQLEQGYADRALAIYEVLVGRDPANTHYRRRRDWLARMATVRQRTVRCVSASTAPPADESTHPPPDLESVSERPREPVAVPRRPLPDQTLRGVVSPGPARAATGRSSSAAPPRSPSDQPSAPPATLAVVRQLSIVRVGRS